MAEAVKEYLVMRGIGLKDGKADQGEIINSKDATKDHINGWLKSGAIIDKPKGD